MAQVSRFTARRGDVNEDGRINIADVSVLLAGGVYGSSVDDSGYSEAGDLYRDGEINVCDIGIILQEENYAATARELEY